MNTSVRRLVLIETPRLLIRSFALEDVPAYAEIVSDPRVTKYLDDGNPHTYSAAESYTSDCIARDRATSISRYAVLTKTANDLIGFCGFKTDVVYVDFGWRYAHRAWGQGIATEAALRVLQYGAEVLGLSNMSAGAYTDNIASVRIIQRLGSQYVVRAEYYGKPTIRYHQSPNWRFKWPVQSAT